MVQHHATLICSLLGGLDESNVDVGEDTTGGDGGVSEELVELFVIADSELNVAGDDSALLGVLGGVASELEHLPRRVARGRVGVARIIRRTV